MPKPSLDLKSRRKKQSEKSKYLIFDDIKDSLQILKAC